MFEKEKVLNHKNENPGFGQDFYRALIENSSEAIVVVSSEATLVYRSPMTAEMLGFDLEEVQGQDISGFVHPQDLAGTMEIFMELVQNPGGRVTAEVRARHADNTWRWLRVTATNLVSDPHVRGILVNMKDITERKQVDERIQRQLQHLSALRTIDLVINSTFDLRMTLNILLDQTISQLGVDSAGILLFNQSLQLLESAAARGFRSAAIQTSQLRIGEGLAGRAMRERRLIHVADLKNPEFELVRTRIFERETFVSYFGVPLIVKGRVIGVLEIFHRTMLTPDRDWIDFLETLAGQAAIAIDNAQLFQNLQRSNMDLVLAYDITIEGWSHAMDLRDKETAGHTQRVTEMTLQIAESMGVPAAQLVHIRRGALLHDIGKIGIPDHILLKAEDLSNDEWEIMRRHPVLAYELLSPIDYLKPALDIPYYHHEKWDGTGYPFGLKGQQIPLAARIFAVVDVWDALLSDRPYRPAWEKGRALDHIREQSGRHFDPEVVEIFVNLTTDKST